MNILRTLLRPQVMISGFIMAVILAFTYSALNQHAAQAACDNNDVIKCGYTTIDDFANKFNANTSGDLKNLYAYFGLTDINAFKSTAKHVTVHKDGHVALDDGTVVATDANSLGRNKIPGNNYSISIANKTYYYGPTTGNFASNTLDGYALINSDDHSFVMAALKACGNPVWGTSYGYKCRMLQQTKVNSNTFSYLATPYVKNTTVQKIVYDFGDGSSVTVTSNFDKAVTHTYAAGDYTAKATVYFMVNGKEQSDTRQECTKPVHVAKPAPTFTCTSLIAKQVSGSRTKFTFTATGNGTNGAVLQSGTFIFDDNSQQTVNASGNTVVTTHDYAKEGNHVTKIDLTFNVGKDVNNQKCVVTTTTVPQTCEDTPNKPECTPPPQNCSNTPSLPECQTPPTPPELPKTGPEQIIGTFLGLGSVTGAGIYYYNSRRNWISQIFKR